MTGDTGDPRAGIIRDQRYEKTLTRDRRRQQWRRAARQWGVWYERLVSVPRWSAPPVAQQPARLSTALMTMDSENRLEPLLRYIRPFSEEVVVGVDSKSRDATWERCQTWAKQGLIDVLFLVENPSLTCNAGMEALVAHCHGDWILRLDDDEFPEPTFARYKAGILANRHYTHYKLPRLHVCSVSPLRWINDGYLYPDYQMRLFRNDPSLLTFPGAIGHLGIRCAGPKGRLNTINLVHLNLAMNPRARREQKLRQYIVRQAGGWVHPVNESALLFEDFPYRIQPYTSGDSGFDALLAQTVQSQFEQLAGVLSA